MKIKIFLLGMWVCIASFSSYGQMINGGFEECAVSQDFPISLANGWHELNNTPDVAHPNSGLPTAPRTGVGNARFGSPHQRTSGVLLWNNFCFSSWYDVCCIVLGEKRRFVNKEFLEILPFRASPPPTSITPYLI
jgi:hypothetical protein